jgi:TnpA family transposase
MPVQLFTEADRARFTRFPSQIEPDDLITFFTLSETDLAQIPVNTTAHNRLGFALQLCALRFMGFVPDNLTDTPAAVVTYVANQLGVDPNGLAAYGARAHTRTDHLQTLQAYLGYRKASEADLEALAAWLLERALEHDKPTLLYELTCPAGQIACWCCQSRVKSAAANPVAACACQW